MTTRIRTGFTLIELLVVIAIIATLMGLLIPSVMFVQARAKKAKTRTFLAQIEAALNSYKHVNGVFPEVIGGPAPTPMSEDPLSNAGGLYTALETVDRENFRAGNLKDPYGNLVAYRPANTYPFYDPANPPPSPAPPAPTPIPAYPEHIHGATPPGADSYQLWSLGSNGIDEVSSSTQNGEYGDDIVTWK